MTKTTDQITPDSESPQTESTGKKKHEKAVIVTSDNYSTLPKGRYSVENGLILYVFSQTSRSWVFRYKMDGRRHDYSIGSANAISLSAAKAKAIKLKAMVLNGINPMQERQKEAAKSEDPIPLFRVLAKDAIALFADVRQWKNPKHAAQWASTIEIYAFPRIGRRLVNTITRDDILAILRPIWRDKTETAKRVRGRLENIFDYAISKGYCKENPARWKANLETFLPSPSKIQEEHHFTSMPLEELKVLAPKLNDNYVSHMAVLFGILTASRAQEFLGATWDEIDFETATWNLNINRTKTSVPHRVPLSRQALAILQRLPRMSRYVFPSPRNNLPMSVDTPRTTIRKMTKTDYTMHGFRSTFRDWGEENFIHDTLLEKALSHSQKSKTVRAYQRSDLLEQRRPVMQQWADTILPDEEPQ